MVLLRKATGAVFGPACLTRDLRCRVAGSGLLVALLAALTWSARSSAQEAPAPAESADQRASLQEVTVTGTRIKREDYVSPNPVQTLSLDELQNLGIVNIADAITQVPSNVSTFTPTNQGGNPFFVGSTLANLRGLNPYFGTRTLTLVDSKRFVPTNQGESVDLNFIPSILIDQVQVVTGGSSAVYGSDAVSGVINILLNKRLNGLKVDADYGATTHGDARNWHAGAAWGRELFEGKSHLVMGGEYQKSEPVNNCATARDWCAASTGMLLNYGSGFETSGSPATGTPIIPGAPQRIIVSGIRVNQVNYDGVIFNGATNASSTIQSDAAGTGTQPFSIGQYGYLSPSHTSLGGDGRLYNDGGTLYPSGDRRTFYAHFDNNFSDAVSGFVDGSWGEVNGLTPQDNAWLNNSTVCVHPDDAYLLNSAGTRTALGAAVLANAGNRTNNFTTIFDGCNSPVDTLVQKDWTSQINRYVATGTKVWRGVVGLSGKLGQKWAWDAYYQYGSTNTSQILTDNPTSKRLAFALDAVVDNRTGSATFGQPVCRVTRDGVPDASPFLPGVKDPAAVALAVGCVPLDLFGTSGMTAAAHAYAFGPILQTTQIRQQVAALSVSGELWQGWGAGPLAAAGGVEFRREKLDNGAADLPFYQRTDFGAQYGDPFAGKTTVQEGYVELEMPFLRDVPAAKLLQINGAVRTSHYKNQDELVTTNPTITDNITTYKLAAVWDPANWLRVRGSWSRDLRAPGFRELYYSQSIPADPPGTFFGFGGVNNPWVPNFQGAPSYDPSVVILSGNTALKPEKATTSTVGFVLTPGGWAQNMHFSADFYRIRIVDGISGGLTQETITNCYNGDQYYCSLIQGIRGGTPGPSGTPGFVDITQVRSPYKNGRPYDATGIDFAWDYLLPLSNLFSHAKGTLAFRLNATHAIKTELQYLQYPNYVARNIVGQSGATGFLSDYASTPKWVGNFSTTYIYGPATVTAQARVTGSGYMNLEAPYTGPGQAGYNPNLTGSISNNFLPSAFYLALTGSYDLRWNGDKDGAQLFLTIDNLLDRSPPYSNGGVGGVNGVFFDTLGRNYRVGIRMRF